MPRTHVEQLFSAAYDGEMSSLDEERFDEHLGACEACAAAYADFRAGVDLVRGLPRARMPLKVHLPSTSPVAERRRVRLPSLSRLRLVPGMATAVAAVAAAALVIVVLNRGGTGTSSTASFPRESGAPNGAGATACHPSPVQGAVSVEPPLGYDFRANASDPQRPQQQLVLATTTGDVTAGRQVAIYAELSLPRQSAGAPNANAPTLPAAAAVPCLSASIGHSSTVSGGAVFAPEQVPVASGVSADQFTATPALAGGSASPLVAFTVPAGTPPGTVIIIVATIPPGYPNPGDPPLTAELQITVR